MGGRQSKGQGQILYEEAVQGHFLSLPPLRDQGADLEWIDEQGKTVLIVACSREDLFIVAKILIELGSNVNAYSPGKDGGTPLHHAAKGGLLQTVKLLLSHGANIYKRNDNGQTPLDVAIEEEKADIVRAIERHMCVFSGWLRVFYGPGLREVVATSWVVIFPSGPFLPPELMIYANLLSTEPSKVIYLRSAIIEEPDFQDTDPSLIIHDKFNRTLYKFASGNPGDWQQIQRLYDACRGIHDVTSGIHTVGPSPVQHNRQTSAPSNGNQIVVEQETESSEENGWGNAARDSTLNGWGSLVGPTPSKVTNGWMEEPPREDYKGWGPISAPTTTESSSNGRDRLGKPTTSEAITTINGWTGEPPKEHATAVASIPSAPFLPDEDFYDDPIQSPGQRVDSSADICTDEATIRRTGEAKDGSASSSCCVICWEMPAEAACVPCGHMAACMACLNEVKSNQGDCPVCRAKIDQVIKIYVT